MRSDCVDYEVELVVVMGAGGSEVAVRVNSLGLWSVTESGSGA